MAKKSRRVVIAWGLAGPTGQLLDRGWLRYLDPHGTAKAIGGISVVTAALFRSRSGAREMRQAAADVVPFSLRVARVELRWS
jgi:hypothetical protein